MFRLDRALTLSFFGPLASLTRTNGPRIPILMYHSISRDIEQEVHPYYRVVTTPEVFAQQMAFLSDEGYQVIGLEAAAKRLRDRSGAEDLPYKPVVITFDDGFLDFYTNAFPVLSKYGFTASVFLPSSFINAGDKTIMGRPFLSWAQVRELIDAGIAFGSHTVSHNYLIIMKQGEIEEELRISKEAIEEKTGQPVRTFSYPYAFPEHNRDFVTFMKDTLQKLGYVCAVSTSIGTAGAQRDAFFLRRIPVNVHDDAALLKAKMLGGYDWMHSLQYTVKTVRGALGMRRRKSIAKWTNLSR